jgi:hypothetical protein
MHFYRSLTLVGTLAIQTFLNRTCESSQQMCLQLRADWVSLKVLLLLLLLCS